MKNIDDIREMFPLLKRKINGKKIIYLDNASTTLKPQPVIDAVSDYYSNHSANIHRGVHLLCEEAGELYETARLQISRFINAHSDEIIFVRNTTEAINIVSRCMPRKKNSSIITFISEHHSNILPWLPGAKMKTVSIDSTGEINLEEFERTIDASAGLAAVSHISNVTGVINPVEEIVRIAHDHGAMVLIDAAQSASHIKLDVKKIACDFLAFSGHKMFGPTGIGVLYAKKEMLKKMTPLMTGGGMVKQVDLPGLVLEEIPYRFEPGTPHIAGAIGLGAAVRFIDNIGMDRVTSFDRELSSFLLKSLSELDVIETYPKFTGDVDRIGTVSFKFRGMTQDEVVSILSNRFNIMVRSGVQCAEPLMRFLGVDGLIRVSTHIYNTKEEIRILVDALKKIAASL